MEKCFKLMFTVLFLVLHCKSNITCCQNRNLRLRRIERNHSIGKVINSDPITIELTHEDVDFVDLDSKDFSGPEKKLWRKTNQKQAEEVQAHNAAKKLAQSIADKQEMADSEDIHA